MGDFLDQIWTWFIQQLQLAVLGLFADIDQLLPQAPDIRHTPQYVAPFLMLLTRFIALDWLFYYGLILVGIYGLVWGWRMLVQLWEMVPFN